MSVRSKSPVQRKIWNEIDLFLISQNAAGKFLNLKIDSLQIIKTFFSFRFSYTTFLQNFNSLGCIS